MCSGATQAPVERPESMAQHPPGCPAFRPEPFPTDPGHPPPAVRVRAKPSMFPNMADSRLLHRSLPIAGISAAVGPRQALAYFETLASVETVSRRRTVVRRVRLTASAFRLKLWRERTAKLWPPCAFCLNRGSLGFTEAPGNLHSVAQAGGRLRLELRRMLASWRIPHDGMPRTKT